MNRNVVKHNFVFLNPRNYEVMYYFSIDLIMCVLFTYENIKVNKNSLVVKLEETNSILKNTETALPYVQSMNDCSK